MSDVKLYNGDCLEVMDMLIEQGIKVDLTVTSPPYDNLRSYNGNNELWNENVWKGILDRLHKITKEGGVVVWVVGDATIKGSETGTSFKQALYAKEIGFNLFDTMIYSKPPRGAVGNNKTYWQSFEYMFVLTKGSPKTINLIIDRENKESRNGDNGTKRLDDGSLLKLKRGGYSKYGRRINIWEYNIGKGHSTTDNEAFKHPAIFPEQLANDHILSWSNENDIIFDPMMGSGTTGKMAVLNNRNFIGIELDKTYFNIAKERIEKAEAEVKLSAK